MTLPGRQEEYEVADPAITRKEEREIKVEPLHDIPPVKEPSREPVPTTPSTPEKEPEKVPA